MWNKRGARSRRNGAACCEVRCFAWVEANEKSPDDYEPTSGLSTFGLVVPTGKDRAQHLTNGLTEADRALDSRADHKHRSGPASQAPRRICEVTRGCPCDVVMREDTDAGVTIGSRTAKMAREDAGRARAAGVVSDY